MASRTRIQAPLFVKRFLARHDMLLMRKSRIDRIRQRDIAALVHAICTTCSVQIPVCPSRLSLLQNLIGTSPAEGVLIMIHLRKSLHLPGDICEFGVGAGATSARLANELAESDKELWLNDTFAGLPKPTEEDVLWNDMWNLGDITEYEGKLAHKEKEALSRITKICGGFNRYPILKGILDNSPDTEGPDQICFAYVDFDFYRPIRDALEFTHERLPVDGVVIVDDYGFFSAGAQRAVDEYIEARRGAYEFCVADPNYGNFCILRRSA